MKVCTQCNINEAAKNRKICYGCRNKQYEQRHPIKAAYYRLKGHAKQRGKDFNLTLSQFEEFCIKVDYIAKKGKSTISYHIDRIDESRGYTIDNIQVLSNSENVKKYKRWVALNEKGESVFRTVIKNHSLEEYEDCPF